jgi:hypothetical protein
MERTYKITGEDWFGSEIARDGVLITLRGHSTAWPFPQERTLPRSALTFMFGDPEPSPEPEREFPSEDGPTDNTGDLFGDREGGDERVFPFRRRTGKAHRFRLEVEADRVADG